MEGKGYGVQCTTTLGMAKVKSINQVYECYWLDKGLRYRAAGWHVKLTRIKKKTHTEVFSFISENQQTISAAFSMDWNDLCNLKSNINSICYVNFWISVCFLYIFSILLLYSILKFTWLYAHLQTLFTQTNWLQTFWWVL